MKTPISAVAAGLGLLMSAPIMATEAPSTVKVIEAKKDVKNTVEDLKKTIESKGMSIFAIIDHQAAAKKAGLTMQPATVIVYGAPKAGTPLMVKDPIFALALPLKVLVTQLPDGKVLVAHSRTDALIEGSKIQPEDVANTLAKAEVLIENVVSKK